VNLNPAVAAGELWAGDPNDNFQVADKPEAGLGLTLHGTYPVATPAVLKITWNVLICYKNSLPYLILRPLHSKRRSCMNTKGVRRNIGIMAAVMMTPIVGA